MRAICNEAGFIEYLLDRRTEINISGLQGKYAINKSLVTCFYTDMIPQRMNQLLREYVAQGVSYQPRVAHVMAPVSQSSQ